MQTFARYKTRQLKHTKLLKTKGELSIEAPQREPQPQTVFPGTQIGFDRKFPDSKSQLRCFKRVPISSSRLNGPQLFQHFGLCFAISLAPPQACDLVPRVFWAATAHPEGKKSTTHLISVKIPLMMSGFPKIAAGIPNKSK
jgi:hypothetical protein